MQLLPRALALLVTVATAVPAIAQTRPEATKFEIINQSLENLLNAGAEITASSMDAVYLKGRAGKWFVCSLDPAGATNNTAPSHCFALN